MTLTKERFTPLDSFVDADGPICYGILKPGENYPGGIPVIKVKNIIDGAVVKDELLLTDPKIHQQYKRAEVQAGDLLLTIRGSVGRVAIVPESLGGANITQDTARIRISSDECSMYVYYALQSPLARKQIELNTVGQAVKGINIGEVRRLNIFHPSRSEQEEIAKILSTWDQAITTAEKLMVSTRQQKKALMQLLLSGKQRLPEFSSKWQTVRFGEAFRERVEAGLIELPLLSITSEEGVIDREETGRKDTSNADKSKYLRICPGDIGYNTMRMWQGVSGLSALEGLVSPAYTVLTPQPGIDPLFAAYLFKLPALVHVFYRHSQGLVSDTWNLKYANFAKIKWSIPSVEEQKAIAAVLSVADREIEILQQQLGGLKQEKKALMQQLLTGKRRVSI